MTIAGKCGTSVNWKISAWDVCLMDDATSSHRHNFHLFLFMLRDHNYYSYIIFFMEIFYIFISLSLIISNLSIYIYITHIQTYLYHMAFYS